MRINPEDAVKLLKAGKVVAVPTETVYGLAADALSPAAVARVFEIKKRPSDNPLICHFHSRAQVKKYVRKISLFSERLMDHFSPGPVSYMLDLSEDSPLRFATCGSQQVIVRIPSHETFLEILRQFDHPVAAPSANTSGGVSPTSAAMVELDLGDQIEGVVDGGSSQVGIESSIIDARSDNEIIILRPGAVGKDEIQKFFPEIRVTEKMNNESVTPGSRYRHYAPRTPVYLIGDINELENEIKAALLLTVEQLESFPASTKLKRIKLIPLGSMKALDEVAQNFYHRLSSLDSMEIDNAFILKQHWGSSSLGKALQNRIEKIVSKR